MKTSPARRIVQTLGVLILAAACRPAYGIPAFARKYGLRCSACHEAWPKLNNFGQVFKDNGFQLMNDRDAPIWQNPSYFPITFRITPQWHRENSNRTAVDQMPGNAASGLTETNLTTSGFDLSGIDIWAAGTLYQNISFVVLPSSDSDGNFHFESAWARFDNLFQSRWLNFKLGKFELDLPDSEKRILTLSPNGGAFQVYHYAPLSITGDINGFGGIGDNQLGIELMGHSRNSYTRYAVSLTSSNNGQPGLPTNSGYDVYGDVTQAWELGSLGLERVGTLAYYGHSPTYYLTANGSPISGTGSGNRPFYRVGAYSDWHIHKWLLNTTYLHGKDNAFLGTGTPANQPLPPGAQGPVWNGGFVEADYYWNPQLVLVGRYDLVRMENQAFPAGTKLPNGVPLAGNLGNTDAFVVGDRWYPIMSSRAGFAIQTEFARIRVRGAAPVTGRDLTTNSFLVGFDFAF